MVKSLFGGGGLVLLFLGDGKLVIGDVLGWIELECFF